MLESIRCRTLAATLVLLGPTALAQNLIVNPGCEAPPASIPPTGWTTSSGEDFYCSTGFSITPPHSGGLFFSVYPTGENPDINAMQQDVDVSSFSNSIDAGSQAFRFEAFYGHSNPGQDIGWIRLSFYDNADQLLGYWDSGNLLDSGSGVWTPVTTRQNLPIGTRKIRVMLQCLRTHPTYCGVRYDDITLTHGTYLSVRALLEGPYDSAADTMSTDLAANGFLPLSQPFSDVEYDGTTLDHDSTLSATSHSNSVVDWVLVSMRNGPTSAAQVVGTTQAALIYSDGTVASVGADSLRIAGLSDGDYYLVLRSRNHLDVMTASPITVADGVGVYDFTTAATQAYPGDDSSAQKELEPGIWGLHAADATVDGQVTVSDFNLWLADTKSGAVGYLQSDFDGDGLVTASDFNLWLANTKLGGSSNVP